MDEARDTAEPKQKARSRRFHLSPDRFVLSLLLVIGLLWLSERFLWFGFNHHKGWTVLIAVAAVGMAALVMLFWWAAGLIFRWRFQFGIRSLLVFCLACSIAAGWFAVELQRARRQAEAVEWIKNSWGGVDYDWELEADYNPINNPEPPGLVWLRKMLGDDFFSSVVEVIVNDTTFTDAGLDHLKGIAQLQRLGLFGTKITDAGVKRLEQTLPNCNIYR